MLGRLGGRVGHLRRELPVALRTGRRVSLVEQRQAASNALERLDALALELDQDAGSVGVGAAADLLAVRLAFLDDLRTSDFGGTRQLALLDEEGCLLLRA